MPWFKSCFNHFFFHIEMYDAVRKGYATVVCCGKIKGQNMWHLLWSNHRENESGTSFRYTAQLQSYILLAMHSEMASSQKFRQYNHTVSAFILIPMKKFQFYITKKDRNFSSFSRACPECRVTSNYVCPSLYWVDTKEEKDLLLTAYKGALGQQNCKYFNKVLSNRP